LAAWIGESSRHGTRQTAFRARPQHRALRRLAELQSHPTKAVLTWSHHFPFGFYITLKLLLKGFLTSKEL